MNKEIISALLPAAMLKNAEGVEESFGKMSVNIDRILRSDFMRDEERDMLAAEEKPHMIIVGEGALRADERMRNAEDALTASPKYEKPYVVVPRVVGNE